MQIRSIDGEKAPQTAITVGLNVQSDYSSLVQLIHRLEFSRPYLDFVYISGPGTRTKGGPADRSCKNLADSVLRSALLAACGKGIPCEARTTEVFNFARVAGLVGEHHWQVIAGDAGWTTFHHGDFVASVPDRVSLLISRGNCSMRGKLVAGLGIDASEFSSRCIDRFLGMQVKGIEEIHLFPCPSAERSSKASNNFLETKTLERFENCGYRTYFHRREFEPGALEQATNEIGGDLLILGCPSSKDSANSQMAFDPLKVGQVSVLWIRP